ncbi:hypothetical protein ACOT81_30815 [Streptomyces sp. WI04-05B]|uniref:hypothetical protein n=1 Tax=Streptomyces TaxID=1883 RepID=UPI0029B22C58|nr:MULTISPECIES: hypothetical protein [unclassified Streptomyces]MDX2542316.1 hypothetical protein [Streptomyces sp. WI04-05B]MDX2584148.1 hypothetical protein [Streptomyces sp. WI04-05A]MDX3751151.1 hypothetical protein [Streptomyces sp. AK08-02]
MEQRIGSSSQPLETAAVDPAAIPGLTSPAPAEPEDGVKDPVPVPEDSVPAEPEATPAEAASPEEEAEPETEADVPEGPVFEASDRRAKIIADHRGVRLYLDDQECEFRWDEIGAVETETSRFGKRFTVTVHTPDRRWYPVEIEAKAKSQHQEWETELDKVLDTYFEDAEDLEESAP